jgi:hypothetical protein
MKDCGHNSVVIKPLVPDDAGACLTPIEAIRYHAVCVDPIHRGGTLLIAGRYLKRAASAQRRLTLPIKLNGDQSEVSIHRRCGEYRLVGVERFFAVQVPGRVANQKARRSIR